jgi:hypothetical protein
MEWYRKVNPVMGKVAQQRTPSISNFSRDL